MRYMLQPNHSLLVIQKSIAKLLNDMVPENIIESNWHTIESIKITNAIENKTVNTNSISNYKKTLLYNVLIPEVAVFSMLVVLWQVSKIWCTTMPQHVNRIMKLKL
jgi:hypothetical protein